MNARNEGYSGARNEVGTPSIGSYSLTVEKSKSTKEASRDRSSCAYQRNPFPATILRASISYWNISSRPMPNPRARMTGIRRKTSATMKIWNAKDLNINTDGADFTFILAIRVFLCKHVHPGFERFNAPCQIRHKVTVILPPQFGARPVRALNAAAAIFGAAVTVKLIVRRAIAHGVIEIEFLSGFNIAHGNQTNLPGETDIRLTGMIETIRRLQARRGFQIEAFFNLQNTLSEVWDIGVQLLFCQDPTSPQRQQFALLD